MKENAKCFILGSKGFEEITYAKLKKHRDTDPTYNKSHNFIQSSGMLMEVSETDYNDFEKNKDRQKYIRKESKRVEEVSLDALDTDEFSGKDVVVDPSPQPDEIVVDKLMNEMLHQCLDRLDTDERALIDALYFNNKTETELAIEYGISQQAISKRHLKIIRQIKKIMKI